MSRNLLTLFKSRRPSAPLDELGGTADGGLAILDPDNHLIHMTPARVASSLRYFLARVQLHGTQGLPSRLALTSALAGEGVTYVTRSLAAVVAYDTQASIAVVDFNWRRAPRGEEDGDRPLGLADAIEDGVPIERVILPTSNPRLSLVPAGVIPVARRPAIAASTALAGVLDELEKRFDHLLLDLPPVLASSDAMNLSQFADAYVLVVQQGVTAEAQVEAALEEMRGAEALGVILNRYDTHIPRRLRKLVGT
jgi:succinoglycan biosynthesis transport protein ExoP